LLLYNAIFNLDTQIFQPQRIKKKNVSDKNCGSQRGPPKGDDLDLDFEVKGQNRFKINIVFQKNFLIPEMESTVIFTFK